MSGALEKFFANLKRLLEPRPRPPAATIEQPSADRPPPPEAPSFREPTFPHDTQTVDAVAVVRAALEAVAEAPVPATELDTEVPPPTLPLPAKQEAVDVPGAPADRVGDALVLTLATPAASFTITRSAATLGRGPENTIRLDDLSVSRRHARIAYRQGGYWLSDLGSMGGTWIGGTRLNAPRRIAAGEVIDIGLCRLTISFAADPMKTEPKKSASRPRSEVAAQVRRRR